MRETKTTASELIEKIKRELLNERSDNFEKSVPETNGETQLIYSIVYEEDGHKRACYLVFGTFEQAQNYLLEQGYKKWEENRYQLKNGYQELWAEIQSKQINKQKN